MVIECDGYIAQRIYISQASISVTTDDLLLSVDCRCALLYPRSMTIQDRKGSLVEKLLTVPEAADRLRLQPSTVRKWIFERRLAYVRVGRKAVRIRESDLEKLLRENYTPALKGAHERVEERQ